MVGPAGGKAVHLGEDAYSRIVLHAAKHVGAVHGLLLASAGGDEIAVREVLPVAHSALAAGTSPLTEVALQLASARARLAGLVVAGMYYAPEVADDTDVPVLPTRLADLLRKDYAHAFLLLLDAKMLHPDVRNEKHCFRLCTMEGDHGASSWAKGARRHEDVVVSKSTLRDCASKLEDSKVVQSIVDFEDHCSNPHRPWIPASKGAGVMS